MSECCSRFQEAIRQLDQVLQDEGIKLGTVRPPIVVDPWVAALVEELRDEPPPVNVVVSVVGVDGSVDIIPPSRVGWLP